MYLLTADAPANPATYGCTGTVCAVHIWPALLTTGRPMAGTEVHPTLLGTVARTIEGHAVHQVTYAGHPLHRFSLDAAAGDTAGEQLIDPGTKPAGIWYLVAPGRGTPDAAPTSFVDRTVPLVRPGASIPYGTADVLTVELDQGLGGLPFPVYTSSADMHHMSVCDSTADCAARWPAVPTRGHLMATGPIGGMLETVGRAPGMHQVTFDGRPLYVLFLDAYVPPGGPPSLPHAIAAHGTAIHPTFTGIDVGTFHLVFPRDVPDDRRREAGGAVTCVRPGISRLPSRVEPSRGGGIRTPDLVHPKHVRYQAAPLPGFRGTCPRLTSLRRSPRSGSRSRSGSRTRSGSVLGCGVTGSDRRLAEDPVHLGAADGA